MKKGVWEEISFLSDAYGPLHGHDEDPSVPEVPGVGGCDYRIDAGLLQSIVHDGLDLGLLDLVDHGGSATSFRSGSASPAA